jgi:hypothetical protein
MPTDLETSADLLEKIKRLDVQIKWSTDIRRRQGYIAARNKLVGQYNKLTGKTVTYDFRR